jgi:acetyl esterase/lipase
MQKFLKTAAVTWGLLFGSLAQAQLADIFTGGDLQDSLQNAIGCDLSARLRVGLNVNPVYQLGDNGCEAGVPGASGTYYRDADCTDAFDFERTSQQQFCSLATSKALLGEAAGEPTGWTLSPGTTYDIGALSLSGLTQPYRRSVVYRSVATGAGECQLVMRIYKNDLTQTTAQNTLIALHGGSWRSRGFGSFGIEALAAQYTDRGFVVFAPFYRLIGSSEGSTACNGASISQVTEDVSAALDWVTANAEAYGAQGLPVVLGQSAGAHLSLMLAATQPQRVAAAVLLYPPTDFDDLLQQLLAGEYTNEEGIGLMNLILGDPLQVDRTASPVPENSFPTLVQQQNRAYPPMQIVHGLADELVPARQSIRLCNALAGRALDEPFDNMQQLQAGSSCGPDSELTLFQVGDHALDICLSDSPLLSSLCLSGGRESRQLIADRLQQIADWTEQQVVPPANTSSGTGAVGLHWLWLLVLLIVRARVRARRVT